MADEPPTLPRRTVLQHAAAGAGGAVALSTAGAAEETSDGECVITLTDTDTYDDACPKGLYAAEIPEDEFGTAIDDCYYDGTTWYYVDWDNYGTTWGRDEDIDFC